MIYGLTMLTSLLYLSFTVCLVISLLDSPVKSLFLKETLRRWCKFLLGLGVIALVVQVFTWFG